MIKTYKGMLADGGQDKIRLRTLKGEVGYQITKFRLMTNQLGDPGQNTEHIVLIWTIERTRLYKQRITCRRIPTHGCGRLRFWLLGVYYF
jgi:hypothetical protein